MCLHRTVNNKMVSFEVTIQISNKYEVINQTILNNMWFYTLEFALL